MMEADLETETARTLESVMGSDLDAIVAIDAHGIVVGWNSIAEKTFGWTPGEAIGRTLGELIIPLQHQANHAAGMGRYLQTGEARVFNRRIEISSFDCTGREFPTELLINQILL